MQRELLPVALSTDPAAALQEFSTQRREDAEEEEEMPPAVAAALEEVLEQLAIEGIEVRGPEELEAALASRPELRAKLETALREFPTGDNPGISEDSGIVPDGDLPDLINRFLAAATWDESQQIVEAHPELLRDQADEGFALALEEYADDPDAVAMLTTHRALLRRCREAGIAHAFAEQRLSLVQVGLNRPMV